MNEACKYLGMCRDTLIRRMKENQIAYRQAKPGAWVKFTQSDLDEYLDQIKRDPRKAVPFTGETYRNRRAKR